MLTEIITNSSKINLLEELTKPGGPLICGDTKVIVSTHLFHDYIDREWKAIICYYE